MAVAVYGPRRIERGAAQRNVGDLERLLSAVGGGALAIAGLKRRGAAGMALAAIGTALVHRGATGYCRVYEALGVTSAAATVNAREAIKVEHAVTVAVPRPEVYAFWRDFDNHPRFMTYVEHVAPQVDGTTRYEASVGGRTICWTSAIVRDIPGELISWKTVEGDIAHAGSVNFRETLDGLGTVVTLAMDYEPPGGPAGQVAARILGLAPDQIVRRDLERFMELLERDAR
jgi:uncharacterized membrane protein